MNETEKELQGNNPNHQVLPQHQAPYYQMPPAEDEIDLFELFSSIFAQWKLIVAITVIGALLSIIFALSIPAIYKSTASVRMPTESQIASINENGLSQFTAQKIFKHYYNHIRAKDNLKNYLIKTNPFPRMFPDLAEEDISQTAAVFSKKFSVEVLEPKASKGQTVEFPELFQISLSSTAESETVKIVNGYVQYIQEIILEEIRDAGFSDISLRSNSLNRDIDLLRSSAKRSREILIEKLTVENQEKIKYLQQQIELLVTKAAALRENKIKILVEARDTAESLNIVEPTTLELLALNKPIDPEITSTQISISSNSIKSDFLMGTKYLDNQIKLLQSRESDIPYIAEIPELLKNISTLKSDTRIVALKSRKSDDPFIDSLPGKLNKLERLKRINFEFGNASLYQIDQVARVDETAENPNRKLIVVLGTLLSGMLALFIALIVSAAQKRSLRKLDN